MKREADNERLLNDVFAEAAPADFREAMLAETRRLARARRRSRQLRRAVLLAAVVLLAGGIWQHSLRRLKVAQGPSPGVAQKSYNLVHSEPLPSSAIITTQPLEGRAFAHLEKVQIVETAPGNFRFINDDELLALLGPRPAVLIRTGPNSEELVFANSGDKQN
jgi:hypothetical protein